MYGMWLRVTPAELEHGKADLDWLREQADAVVEAEEETEVAGPGRVYCTDKTWHALDHLLSRRDFPVMLVLGDEDFVDDPEDPDADWGYGAPRYLTPDQVRIAAEALAPLTEADLIDGVDQAELTEAEIYPTIWDRPDELRWAVSHLPEVKTYFAAAAAAGDAVICWIT